MPGQCSITLVFFAPVIAASSSSFMDLQLFFLLHPPLCILLSRVCVCLEGSNIRQFQGNTLGLFALPLPLHFSVLPVVFSIGSTSFLLPSRGGMSVPLAPMMRPAATSAASDYGSNRSVMQTSLLPTGTTLFLREEGSRTFVPVYHQSSVTLRDLAEEFNISSVLECDAHGNVQPRAIALDSPSDVLHSGRHYIARRDARAEAGNSYVTFRGKILVKEYELEHPTPLASRGIKTLTTAGDDVGSASHAHKTHALSAATPFPEKRSMRQSMSEENRSTISRALALSSERKRPREDTSRIVAEGAAMDEESQQRSQAQRAEESQLSSATQPGKESVLQDRTNATCVPPRLSGKPSDVQSTAEASKRDRSSCEPPPRSLRFIPFLETASDGSETYVTLEDLQRLCQEVDTQEEAFQKRHKTATDILESARRVLFTTGEVD
ncbi:hypothetical protein CUR178_05430 [Leishmania enriettii]|uniref:Uncharacterized protein n=1 Tax=Leishmania enriettii TaxID=5663 RepID=A0A836KQB6_LEIEN|nr:hypothetical protein CUR178_05430 [Leishmania enriettii]